MDNINDIEKIIPLKTPRGMAISSGKFAAKLKRISGINLELCNSDQPERSKREDLNYQKVNVKMDCDTLYPHDERLYSRCGALNIVETQ